MKWTRNLGWILFLGLWACTSTSPDAGTSPSLDILHFAGDIPDQDWNYLPYPAHFGTLDDYRVFLLSKAPNPGTSRSIHPVGMLSTLEGGMEVQWIIANDAHEDYQIDGLSSVDDLMTNHNGIKSTLERWIINRHGIGQVMMKGWKDAPSLDYLNNQ